MDESVVNQNKNIKDAGSVDELCDLLRARWGSDAKVTVEDLVQGSKIPLDDESAVLRLIQVELELRRQTGESVSADDIAKRFPDVDANSIHDLILLPAPPPPDHSGPLLPSRYRPIKELGRGGIGSVWRVFDKTLERPLAVKVLHEKYRNDVGANARLDVEALLTGVLQHPGVPPVHDRGELVSGSSYFSMKLVEGETLAAILNKKTNVADQRTHLLGIFEQIAQTIAYAHSQKIIHRDLKPANIMVGEFGEVQVMDWGLAKILGKASKSQPDGESTIGELERNEEFTTLTETILRANDSSIADSERNLTRQGDVIGTPAYMSPEQARGDISEIDEACDVFSLGAILLEILTGKPLYDEVDISELLDAAAEGRLDQSLERLNNADVEDELKKICRNCLEPDASQRPASSEWVVEQIQSYLESVEARLREAEMSKSRAEVKVAEERKRKRLAYVLNGIIVIAVALAFVAVFWYQREQEKRRVEKARNRAETLVTSMSAVPLDALPIAIENLDQEYAIEFLERSLEKNKDRPDQRLRYAVALAFLGKPQTEYLADRLISIPVEDASLIGKALSFDSGSLKLIESMFQESEEVESKAKLGLCAAYLGNTKPLSTWLSDLKNVEARCSVIDVCSYWKLDVDVLIRAATESDDPTAQYSLLCGVAEIPLKRLGLEQREKWAEALGKLCLAATTAHVRSAAELILRRWEQPIPKSKVASSEEGNRNWYQNSAGMVMVKVTGFPRGRFASGGYDFYVSDREVSVQQVLTFLDEDKEAAEYVTPHKNPSKSTYQKSLVENLRRDPLSKKNKATAPIRNFGYYCVLRYCNWLSRCEGLEPFYVDQNQGVTSGREKWTTNPLADGYRLPENSEFVHIQKPHQYTGLVEASSRFHPRFAWYLKNASDPQPIASRLPNVLGLFDVFGNLAEMGQFTDEFEHRHSWLGGSIRSIDIRDLNTGGVAWGKTYSYTPDVGFRVVRLDLHAAKTKRINHLLLEAYNAKNSNDHFKSWDKAIAIGQQLHEMGEYEKTYSIFDGLNKKGYQLVKGRKYAGRGYQVQASARFALAKISHHKKQYELASRHMVNANSYFTQALARKAIDDKAAQLIQREMHDFESRLNIKRAFEIATHWDLGKRRTRSAYFMALQSIEHLGEENGQILADYAAVLAADKKFEEAIRVQEKAISLTKMADTPKEWSDRLELYRNSKPYVREKPPEK